MSIESPVSRDGSGPGAQRAGFRHVEHESAVVVDICQDAKPYLPRRQAAGIADGRPTLAQPALVSLQTITWGLPLRWLRRRIGSGAR